MNKYSDLARPQTQRGKRRTHESRTIGIKSSKTILKPSTPLVKSSKSPVSGFSLKLSELPDMSSSNLSSLTSRQNVRMISLSPSLSSGPQKASTSRALQSQMRSEEDFLKLMSQLDSVINSKRGDRHIYLYEKAPHEHFTEAGKTQYFRVNVKGKICPLKVNLVKYSGIFRASYALNNPEPDFQEFGVKRNTFEVSDTKRKFRTEFVGIGVQALTDTKYAISVRFGNTTLKNSSSDAIVPIDNPRDLDTPLSKRKTVTKYNKNFIEINKKSVPLNSPRGEHMVKFKDWKQRRDMVVIRKHENRQQRREKTILMLNRQAIKKEERLRLELEEENAKHEIQRYMQWLKFIYLAKSVDVVHTIVQEVRNEKIHKLKRQNSVRRIQKVFRDSVLGMSPKSFNVAKSFNCFRISCSAFYMFQRKSVELKILAFVKQTRDLGIPKLKFLETRKKVELIQKQWRAYSKVNNDRWNSLILLWNKVLDRIEFSRSSSLRKRKSSRENIVIRKSLRNEILQEYFKRKKQEYLANVKVYFVTRTYSNQTYPQFDFIPTETLVSELINKAANSTRLREAQK